MRGIVKEGSRMPCIVLYLELLELFCGNLAIIICIHLVNVRLANLLCMRFSQYAEQTRNGDTTDQQAGQIYEREKNGDRQASNPKWDGQMSGRVGMQMKRWDADASWRAGGLPGPGLAGEQMCREKSAQAHNSIAFTGGSMVYNHRRSDEQRCTWSDRQGGELARGHMDAWVLARTFASSLPSPLLSCLRKLACLAFFLAFAFFILSLTITQVKAKAVSIHSQLPCPTLNFLSSFASTVPSSFASILSTFVWPTSCAVPGSFDGAVS